VIDMLEKNKKKLERKNRKLWNGFYTRKPPTKKEKLAKEERKLKKSLDKDNEKW